ncbi:Uncharacterised protein [Chromobacterium violaceum]|uniref:Uncharacterized protein n=1 Tax=Chromobacterium violaceum TaxID=536 RepID=A0A3S4LIH3_CHRVL|nr:Uncharacterised protein [Chromobacterium violaceum]
MLNPISAIGAQAFSQSGDGVQSLQQRVALPRTPPHRRRPLLAPAAGLSASGAGPAAAAGRLPQAKQEQIDAIARLLREFGEGGQPPSHAGQQLEVIDMALKEEGEASPCGSR